MNARALLIAATLSAATSGFSTAHADPDCAGPDHWPASMTFAQLKNARVLTNDEVDFSRTASTLIASQKIGADLYRQVFLIKYFLKDGRSENAIAVSDASNEECSMSDVTVYRIVDPQH